MSDDVLILAFAAVAALSSTGRAGDYFTVRSSDRDYEVLKVSGQPLSSNEPGDAAAKPALIIGLHGYGINEKQMATLVPLTLQAPHVYVAPRGDYDLGDGSYGWFPRGCGRWQAVLRVVGPAGGDRTCCPVGSLFAGGDWVRPQSSGAGGLQPGSSCQHDRGDRAPAPLCGSREPLGAT